MPLDEIYQGDSVANDIVKAYLGETAVFERVAGGNDPLIDALLAQAATDGYTPFSGSVLTAADTFIKQLVTDGIINEVGDREVKVSNFLDFAWLLATNGDSDFACYNILDPTKFNLTKVNSPVFTSLQGFAGNGVNAFLNTNVNLSIDTINYALNDASMGVYVRTVRTGSGSEVEIGSRQSGGVKSTFGTNLNSTSSNAIGSINDGGFPLNVTGNEELGLATLNRTSSTSSEFYMRGVLENLISDSVSSIPNSEVAILAEINASGGIALPSTKQVSFSYLGANMGSKQLAFYNSIQSYMTTLGTQV